MYVHTCIMYTCTRYLGPWYNTAVFRNDSIILIVLLACCMPGTYQVQPPERIGVEEERKRQILLRSGVASRFEP